MFVCNKCSELGLKFNRRYKPEDFLEGKPSSKIWIIGLNPANKVDWQDIERAKSDLPEYFKNLDRVHPYFKNFKKVSPKLFDLFGQELGVAHTDLIKCSSEKWPPENCKGKKAQTVIANCKPYLLEQIKIHKPSLIICNGAPVSHEIQMALPMSKKISDTAYESKIDKNTTITVILSGFIGRIDNFSKRRLGYEIEGLMEELSLF
jgi:uracil-DNA glycosylase family 4